MALTVTRALIAGGRGVSAELWWSAADAQWVGEGRQCAATPWSGASDGEKGKEGGEERRSRALCCSKEHGSVSQSRTQMDLRQSMRPGSCVALS